MQNRYTQYALLLVWVVIGGLVGYLRSKAVGHVYESRATVFVPSRLVDARTFEASAPSDFRQARAFLTSDTVLDTAVRDTRLKGVFEFADLPDLRAVVRSRVSVAPASAREGAFDIAFRGRTREGTLAALATLVDAYAQSMRTLESGVQPDFIRELESARNQLNAEVTVERDVGGSESAPKPRGNGKSPERLAALESSIYTAARDVASLEGELARWESLEKLPAALIDSGAAAPPKTVEPPPVVAQDDRHQDLSQKFLGPLVQQQQQLLKEHGRDHVKVKEVRQRIAIMTRLLASRTDLNERLIPLLVDEQILLGEFGESHPKVVELRKKIAETASPAGAAPAVPTPESAAPAEGSAGPDSAPTDPATEPATEPAEPAREERPKPEKVDPAVEKNRVVAQLAAKEAELAALRQLARLARSEWLFEIAAKKLEAIEAASLVGPAKVELLSPPSIPALLWWLDVQNAAIGAAIGMAVGILVLLLVRVSMAGAGEPDAGSLSAQPE